jgi:nitrile hydratase subunit alpha
MPAHDHDHHHDHQVVPSDLALRTKALESLLVEKGLVDRAALSSDGMMYRPNPPAPDLKKVSRGAPATWPSAFTSNCKLNGECGLKGDGRLIRAM